MAKVKCDFNTVKNGFERFYRENGRHPSVFDIDSCLYLPSSRQIQRIWPGGVKEVRKLLGIEITDFTTGNTRSTVARNMSKRGREIERQVQAMLVSKFGEVFVHEQKPFDDYSGRFDFVVYSKTNKFAVDVFYATDKASFTGCLNSKINTYRKITFPVYLLQVNTDIFSAFNVNSFIARKRNTLPAHITLLSLEDFQSFITSMDAYSFKL